VGSRFRKILPKTPQKQKTPLENEGRFYQVIPARFERATDCLAYPLRLSPLITPPAMTICGLDCLFTVSVLRR
jgi:hypothetical protein